jgi:hypothetical protein
MSNELHELSIVDLDEVSGGDLRYFPGPAIVPSIPIPPPLLGLLGAGPVIPVGHPVAYGSPDPRLQ